MLGYYTEPSTEVACLLSYDLPLNFRGLLRGGLMAGVEFKFLGELRYRP